ncbi:MAG: DNA helicase UvrD [Pedobacter sp.]|nr:MAG: DNA helicase UvrD [Pedobacter sp.]
MAEPLKILKASAGSGKTFSLAAHYLSLLFSGKRKYREILAVTFTNKATEEMKTRILEVLEGFARGSDAVSAYREIVLQAHPELSEPELQLRADEIYRQILHDYSRFSVGTLDGFMQKVIRGFTFELNLNAGYSLEINQDKVISELTDRIDKRLDSDEKLLQWIINLAYDRIEAEKNWDYKKELIGLSKEVFKEEFEPFLTSLNELGEHAEELFQTYILLSQEEINQFESQVVGHLQRMAKVFEQSSADKADLNGRNTGSLLKLNSIQDWSEEVPKIIESLFKLMDDEARWFKKGKSNSLFLELNPLLNNLQEFISEHSPSYYLAKAYQKRAYFLRLMQEVAEQLKLYRSESDNLMISDAQKLLLGIAEDAGENPSFIWEKMGNVYKHFLFDEFQDTSGSQWKTFRSLVKNAIAEHTGLGHDHLIVGDTKQAIYGWRGGDYKLLHEVVKAEIGADQILEANLQDNRRSSSVIIDFNNRLYEELPKLLQSLLNNSIPEIPSLQDFWFGSDSPYADLLPAIYANGHQHKHAKTPLGGKVKIRRIDPKLDYAVDNEAIALLSSEKDFALYEMTLQVQDLMQQEYVPRDIGVLVRTNSEAALVVEALMAKGYDVISGEALKIANNTAIKLILNVLNLLVANTQQRAYYIGLVAALYAKVQQRKISGADYLSIEGKTIADMSHLLPAKFCTDYSNWKSLPLSEIIELIIGQFLVDTQVALNPAYIPFVLAFKDIAARAAQQGERGIVSFLHWWQQESDKFNLPSPEKANAIQVMTIHKSKGLAFRAVLVPFCNWELKGRINTNFWVDAKDTSYKLLGSLPLNFEASLGKSTIAIPYFKYLMSQYLEALNNLYVATTRAIDFIYIGVAAQKTGEINKIGAALMQALVEIPNEHSLYEEGDYLTRNTPMIPQAGYVLHNYVLSPRIQKIYEPLEEKALPYLINLEASAKRGELLHAIMANTAQATEVRDRVKQFVLEGFISDADAEEYNLEALKIYASPSLQDFFNGSGEHLNELSIITAEGKTKRPDKVLIQGDKARILDYKFTLDQTEKHFQQVLAYRDLLQDMGYAQVDAYLYYALKDQLIKVNA